MYIKKRIPTSLEIRCVCRGTFLKSNTACEKNSRSQCALGYYKTHLGNPWVNTWRKSLPVHCGYICSLAWYEKRCVEAKIQLQS